MACIHITTENAEITLCGFPDYQDYWCFEHTTYLFSFKKMSGPAWFRMPNDEQIFPDPDGSMAILWDMFYEWFESYKGYK